jgi:endonuclease/exonuclease/phosphatase family metal-dependent hydrolase
LEDTVKPEYRSKSGIESVIGTTYPYKFFGALWVTDAFRKEGKLHRDFGGLIEQGNEILSKYPIVEATNEHYYKSYSLALDWTNWKQEDHGRVLQVVELENNCKKFQVLNIHGIWTEDKKGDDRTIKQCEYVVNAAKRKDIPTIITGDFNLSPDSPSIQKINNHFRNLIGEYSIGTTRPDFDDGTDKGKNVVDYVFVSNDIEVKKFETIQTDISDHLPLMLDFELK